MATLNYMQEYYKRNKEQVLARHRAWRAANKERHLAKAREYYHANKDDINARRRAHRKANPDFYSAKRRNNKYGLTPEEFARMSEAQGRACAVCLDEKPLVVDHCHTTGRVRALLCSPCNTALGLLKEDPSRMAALAAYVSKETK